MNRNMNEHERALLSNFEYGPGQDFRVCFWPGDGPEYYRITGRKYDFDAGDAVHARKKRQYELTAPAEHGWEREVVTEDDLLQHYEAVDEIPERTA